MQIPGYIAFDLERHTFSPALLLSLTFAHPHGNYVSLGDCYLGSQVGQSFRF